MLFPGRKTEPTIHIAKLLYLASFVVHVALRKCSDQQFSVRTESGITKCRDCPLCPEGFEVTPKCGSEISHNASTSCVPCVSGKTFSDTRSVGACHMCGICSVGQVIKQNCTRQSQIVCDKRCTDKAMYFNEYTKDCKPCSKCCKDGHDTVIEECREKGVVLGMQCSAYDESRCQKSSTPETQYLTTEMATTQVPATTQHVLHADNLSIVVPEQITPMGFDTSSTMSVTSTHIPNVTKQQNDEKTTTSKGKNNDPFPTYMKTIIIVATCIIAAAFVCGLVVYVIIKKRGQLTLIFSSRSESSQSHQRCNNRNCVFCAEEGHSMEVYQMTERDVTRGDNSGNTTASSVERCQVATSDQDNESREGVDESENDPLLILPPPPDHEDIQHMSNCSSNLSSGNSTEEASQNTNGSTPYMENESRKGMDGDEKNPLIVSLPEQIGHIASDQTKGNSTEEACRNTNGSTPYMENESRKGMDGDEKNLLIVSLPEQIGHIASDQTKETNLKEVTNTPEGFQAFERVLKHMDRFIENGGYLYEKVAGQFGIEQENVWEFEKEYRRPGGSPSKELFHFLGAKDPTLTVGKFIVELLKVEHAGKNKVAELLKPFVYINRQLFIAENPTLTVKKVMDVHI